MEKRVGVGLARSAQRDAEAGPQRDGTVGDDDRLCWSRRECVPQYDFRIADLADVVQDDGELVAAEPGHQVRAEHAATERAVRRPPDWSPPWCPNVSLICLNPFMSASTTAVLRPVCRVPRQSPCVTVSYICARLASPVRVSVTAIRWLSRCTTTGGPPPQAVMPTPANARPLQGNSLFSFSAAMTIRPYPETHGRIRQPACHRHPPLLPERRPATGMPAVVVAGRPRRAGNGPSDISTTARC